MNKQATLTKYELVMIVDSGLADSAKEEIYKAAADAITKSDGKVLNSQVWLDKQRFAFDIKKYKEGTYYMTNFEAEGDITAKLTAVLKLNEKILRFGVFIAE